MLPYRWSYILYKLVSFYVRGEDGGKTLWETTQLAVIIFQNAAALEVRTIILPSHLLLRTENNIELQLSSRLDCPCFHRAGEIKSNNNDIPSFESSHDCLRCSTGNTTELRRGITWFALVPADMVHHGNNPIQLLLC